MGARGVKRGEKIMGDSYVLCGWGTAILEVAKPLPTGGGAGNEKVMDGSEVWSEVGTAISVRETN